jgi:MFS family permease
VSTISPAPSQHEHDLRAIIADGVFFSVMVGLGEAYVPAFALAVGLGEIVAGLVATVPMLAGAVLQLVTPLAVRRLGSYRRWVVICARLQALSFLPLIAGAAVGDVSLLWVGIATIGYWGFGMSTGPAWNAWVTTLVPVELRAGFFARRARAAQAALFAGLLLGGLALEAGRIRSMELPVFAALFAGALLCRLVSSGFLAKQSERPDLARSHPALRASVVWERLRGAGSARVLTYLLATQGVTHIAAPYFTPYMLGPLALSYGQFMALTAASFFSRMAVLPLLGRIAHERGTRPLLWLGGVGIVPLPVLWLVSDAFAYLLAIQLLAGVAWAALEFATTLSFFERIEESDRSSVLAAFNLCNALAIVLGALVGAQIFACLDGSATGYAWLFAVSSAGRLLSVALLRRTPAPEHVPPDVRLRTLAVRPSGVAVQRPILASVSSEAPEAPVPRGREE